MTCRLITLSRVREVASAGLVSKTGNYIRLKNPSEREKADTRIKSCQYAGMLLKNI